jgi:NADH:ubiquinone oxidoreductase subunit 5 (subunit L)/multisubunit Na+/H+ antiporter MnhA subunit
MVVAWRLFGVELAGLRLSGRPALVTSLTRRFWFLYRASANKWWFDDINNLLFVVIGGRFANACAWFDRNVVDGIVNGIGALTRRSGSDLARVQTGRVQNYALGIALGLIAMAGSYFVILGR